MKLNQYPKKKKIASSTESILIILLFFYILGTHGFLWTYASISSLGCIFIAICLPETRGKTPFEIADFYEAKSAKNSSKYTAQASNIMRKINFPQFRRSSSSANSLKQKNCKTDQHTHTQYFFTKFMNEKDNIFFCLKIKNNQILYTLECAVVTYAYI